MNLSELFIKRKVLSTLSILAIVLLGSFAFFSLSVNDLPSVEHPTINVSTHYPGASSQKVYKEVTDPLEKELSTISGIEEISSTSSKEHSNITIEFSMRKDMQKAYDSVKDAIFRIRNQLPDEIVDTPQVYKHNASLEPILSGVVFSLDNKSIPEISAIFESTIKPRLTRIEGVSSVTIYGPEHALLIDLNHDLLDAYDVTMDDLLASIEATLQTPRLGTIESNGKTLSVLLDEPEYEKNTFQKLQEIPIQNKEGLYLSDIADIRKKDDESSFSFITKDTKVDSIIFTVNKTVDANTVAVCQNVEKTVKKISQELSGSISIHIPFNKAFWIQEALSEVEWSLLFAFILVIAVIYLSLGRFLDALIPSAALPLSILSTFFVMYLSGYSLDILSLLALTLAVGFVVDDAIVVVENIVRQSEMGKSRMQAAIIGSKEILFTIISMTLSLIAVFIPLLFMHGMLGRFFSEFSMTLSIAILLSGIISLTITPFLASRFLSTKNSHSEPKKIKWYIKSLTFCMKYTKSTLALAAILMPLTYYLFSTLSVQLIPQERSGIYMAAVEMPEDLSKEQKIAMQADLEKTIQNKPYVKEFFDFSYPGGLFFFITEEPSKNSTTCIIQDIQNSLNDTVGVSSYVALWQLLSLNNEIGHFGSSSLTVRAHDQNTLEHAFETIETYMQNNPEVSFYHSNRKLPDASLFLSIDDALCQALGVSKRALHQQIENTLVAKQFDTKLDGAKIYLAMNDEATDKLDLLSKSRINDVPLSLHTSWKEGTSENSITRSDTLFSTSCTFSAPESALKTIEESIKNIIPKNSEVSLDRKTVETLNAKMTTGLLILLSAFAMYLILGILYESFIHPLTILSSLPLAAFGGMLTLVLFSEPISIFSAVGFLLLLGIVKKNGIMVVDYALSAKKKGLSAEEAIIQASTIRFRPIMMTTFAAIMGALPIACGLTPGAEVRQGLGLVIVGGLLFSQMLTLYVTPCLFLFFERLQKSKKICR